MIVPRPRRKPFHGPNIDRPAARALRDCPPCAGSVQSQKLQHVRYDVRGPILVEAQRLEAEGHRILKLNIGNPAPFGFEAPEAIVADMVHHLPEAQGYSDSQGIYSGPHRGRALLPGARAHATSHVDDVYIGNGVSELISMVLQAFVDDGNEILVPAPDYPLWTGAVTLSGGTPVHYRCDEDERLGPRPRRHRVQDHRAHPRPGHHQPQQPDRRRLQRGDGARAWSTSPGATTWS